MTRSRRLLPLLLTTAISPLLADKTPENDPNVIFATGFENDDWRKHWDGGKRKTVAVIDQDPARKFAPLHGKALSITTPKGQHYGASIEFPFNKTKDGEPTEIHFRYYLRLGDDWNPTDGGKFPGIGGTYGKAGWGGRPADGTNGWSARGLFRGSKDGKTPIGFYCYHAEMKGQYGDNFLWDKDNLGLLENNRWYCIEQYARLNTIGKSDGILRAWIDGQLAFEKTDLRMRHTPNLKIQNIWINLYHGGKSPASSEDHVFIDDIVISRAPIGPRK
ncbi:MAG: polysaccharide lyase [Verrucomicrobiaceae bacterium]